MQKNFDDLTIVDDYMFCTVMQDEELCKELLSMILKIRSGRLYGFLNKSLSKIR